MRSYKRLLMNVPNVITQWNRIAKMKKTILIAIALLCLSTPLQAQEVIKKKCLTIGIPCYIDSDTTVLREKPNKDSRITLQASPARKGSKIYFYLRDVTFSGTTRWGYFEAVEPIVDLATGKTREGGWTPLDNAFSEMVGMWSLFEGNRETMEGVMVALFKPNTFMLLVNSKFVTGVFPLKGHNMKTDFLSELLFQ